MIPLLRGPSLADFASSSISSGFEIQTISQTISQTVNSNEDSGNVPAASGRGAEAPFIRAAEMSSALSSSLRLGESSPIKEVDTEDSERTETEVSDNELPSLSKKKKIPSKRSDWTWDQDKLLIQLFNDATRPKWIKLIVSKFSFDLEEDAKHKKIQGRVAYLTQLARKTSGILRPALRQIDDGADSKDFIRMKIEKLEDKIAARAAYRRELAQRQIEIELTKKSPESVPTATSIMASSSTATGIAPAEADETALWEEEVVVASGSIPAASDRGAGAPFIKAAEMSSALSSSLRLDESSFSKEVDTEDSERTETEVSDNELPSLCKRSDWTWDQDKLLIQLFIKAKKAKKTRWMRAIVSKFSFDLEEEEKYNKIRGRFSHLMRSARQASGILRPAPWQIKHHRADAKDFIRINLEELENKVNRGAGGTRSDYWTWERDEMLVKLFHESPFEMWIENIKDHFKGQNGVQIAAHFRHLLRTCDPQTGKLTPSKGQKNAKEGAFVIIDLEKVRARKPRGCGRGLIQRQIEIESSKKSSESVPTATSIMASSSTATGIAPAETDETALWEEEVVVASGSVPLASFSGTGASTTMNHEDPSLLQAASILYSFSSSTTSSSVSSTTSSSSAHSRKHASTSSLSSMEVSSKKHKKS